MYEYEFVIRFFSEDELATLTNCKIKIILKEFSGKTMMLLPKSEIIFFEWLKKYDEKIWLDIWQDASIYKPYIVSIDFLPIVLDKDGRGYPISDLQKNDNYYFTMQQMLRQESKVIIEAARELFLQKKKLTPAQLLALEISIAPIDIWHFSYKHNLDLAEAKAAVASLVADEALIHLKMRKIFRICKVL